MGWHGCSHCDSDTLLLGVLASGPHSPDSKCSSLLTSYTPLSAPFLIPVNKHLLRTHCVPAAVLGAEHMSSNQNSDVEILSPGVIALSLQEVNRSEGWGLCKWSSCALIDRPQNLCCLSTHEDTREQLCIRTDHAGSYPRLQVVRTDLWPSVTAP